jgi:hypothetical protein
MHDLTCQRGESGFVTYLVRCVGEIFKLSDKNKHLGFAPIARCGCELAEFIGGVA